MSAWLGAVLGWFVGSLLGVRRAHVLDSLARAGVDQPRRVADAMYRSLGTGVFELLGLLLTPWRGVKVAGLDEALGEFRNQGGTGAVVATAHTGNWDWVACATAQAWPLTVITKRLSVGFLDKLWQGFRLRRGVRLVQAGAAARAALGSLAQGHLVAAMIDQAPERARAVVQVPFLGQLAEVDLAPALLALRARAPMLVAFSKRTREGHALEVLGWLTPPERPTRDWAPFAMRQATRWLDDFVRQNPEQWLWMHRRWKRSGSRLLSPEADAGAANPGA